MLSSTQYPQRFLDLYNLAKDLSQNHQINLEKTFDNILEVENPQLTIMGLRGALGKKGFFLNKEENNQPLNEQEEQRKMTVLYQKYQNRQQIPKEKVSFGQKDIGDEFLVILEQMQQSLELNSLKSIHELEGRLKKEFQQGKQEGVDIQQFIDFQEIFEKKFATFDQKIKSIQNKLDTKTDQETIEEMNEKIESLEHRLKEEERKNKKMERRYDELLERFNEFQESQCSQNSKWENKFLRLEEENKENKKPMKKMKKKRSHSQSSSSSNDEEIQTSK